MACYFEANARQEKQKDRTQLINKKDAGEGENVRRNRGLLPHHEAARVSDIESADTLTRLNRLMKEI